jgi:Putative heavy-metal-binding
MGLRPVGLVQGYYCGMIAGWANYSTYPETHYPCCCMENEPHSPGWVGRVDQLDASWAAAHGAALERMLKEASDLGAHGVVGVKTEMNHPTNEHSCEVHLYGTAVVVEGAQAPKQPWSTQLAGHKLAKLIEAGFSPASVIYARSTTVMVEGCYMEYYGSGRAGTGNVIKPIVDAHQMARSGALNAVKHIAGRASLYDVRLHVDEAERHSLYVTCSLLGSLVWRARPTLPIATPVSTVSLGS